MLVASNHGRMKSFVICLTWLSLSGSARGGVDPQLFAAVRGSDLAAVTGLLRNGADVNARDPEGFTPVMIAAGLGQPQMVNLLLTAGADIHLLDPRMGATALHKAAQGGVVEVADLLLRRGAFIDAQAPTLGHTPLIDAVWHKRQRMVGFLLEQGAKTTLRTHAGNIALDWAKRDQLKEIIALIETADADRARIAGRQLLMEAIRRQDLDAVKQRIQAGDDVNERTPMIGSPDDGHTPLLLAARAGLTDIVRVLLAAGADPRRVDGLIKATPGHKSGYMGHADVARLLVASPLELDAQGPYNGYTALHDAIWHGHTEAAKVYLEAGARLDLRGHDGRIPLDVAREEGYPEIVALIEARLAGKAGGGDNALRAFVHQWFDWFDRQADVSVFLAHLSPSDLEMRFPERTLASHADFIDWYQGIRRTIRANSHEVSDVTLTRGNDGLVTISLHVHWKATTAYGKSLEMKVRQSWTVEERPGGRYLIRRYVVET